MLGLINAGTGLIGGLARGIVNVKQSFSENAENRGQRLANAKSEATQQFAAEFVNPNANWLDSLISALNRLPRPLIAHGTIALFVYAFVDPEGFAITMESLNLVPPELWWLLGAVVSFYFGARELKYIREHKQAVHRIQNGGGQSAPEPTETRKERRQRKRRERKNPALAAFQDKNKP